MIKTAINKLKTDFSRKSSQYFGYVLLFLSLFLNVSYAETNHPALNLVKTVSDQMIQDLKLHAAEIKRDPHYVYQLAYKHIVPRADLDDMSRRVLAPNVWYSMSAQQKSAFKKQFTLLLIRTYASALNSYRNQTIRFFPIRSDGNNDVIQIDTEILESGNQPIRVSYKLKRGQGWKLVDLTVEGVSLISSFRSQFSSLLNQNDVNALIRNMETHNAE